MFIEIHFQSGKPTYLQIVDQVKTAVASGRLREGDALPGIRPLAERLRINRNTVAKAYTELERQGVVATRAGKGCFIAESASPFNNEVRERMLLEAIDAATVEAHHLQVTDEAFLDAVQKRLQLYAKKKQETNATDDVESRKAKR